MLFDIYTVFHCVPYKKIQPLYLMIDAVLQCETNLHLLQQDIDKSHTVALHPSLIHDEMQGICLGFDVKM